MPGHPEKCPGLVDPYTPLPTGRGEEIGVSETGLAVTRGLGPSSGRESAPALACALVSKRGHRRQLVGVERG